MVIVALVLSACGPAVTPKPTPTPSLYVKLAVIDTGSSNPPQSLIDEFALILDRLSEKCPRDSQEDMANYIVKAQSLLQDKGRDMTLIEITRAVNLSIPDGAESGVAATWLPLSSS
jgi:hypothetical protein